MFNKAINNIFNYIIYNYCFKLW